MGLSNAILDSGDTDVTQYRWDARNRLTKITDYETYGGDPTQVVDYLYDLENRWIGKRVDSDGDGTFDSQEGYVYDGNQMVLRFEGEDDLSHRYLWQPDAVDQLMADEKVTHGVELADFEPTPQVYGPVQMSETGSAFGPAPFSPPARLSKPATSEVTWTLTDQLGTVRDLAVVDAETDETSVVNHITYDAFGQKVSETNAAVDCLFGFTGRAFDDDTDLQNNLNRWYDANTGRWMSKDPIGFDGHDANTYRYVGNSPLNVTDPSGLVTGVETPDWSVIWKGRHHITKLISKIKEDILDMIEWWTHKAGPYVGGPIYIVITSDVGGSQTTSSQDEFVNILRNIHANKGKISSLVIKGHGNEYGVYDLKDKGILYTLDGEELLVDTSRGETKVTALFKDTTSKLNFTMTLNACDTNAAAHKFSNILNGVEVQAYQGPALGLPWTRYIALGVKTTTKPDWDLYHRIFSGGPSPFRM